MMNRLPQWFKQDLPDKLILKSRRELFSSLKLNTVCQNAHCPNMGACFKDGQATFLILGDTCTRNCRFCAVKKGTPLVLDLNEPVNLAKAIEELNLDYVVITSVTRDDLKDCGARQFQRSVLEIRKLNKNIKIELLIPDFAGSKENLEIVVSSRPDVIAHNLETVSRLYNIVRPQADYRLALEVLNWIKKIDKSIFTKSGIMAGLGESFAEVIEVMRDLRRVNCDILTIGQYLAPSKEHLPVEKFLSKEEFDRLKAVGESLGFKCVVCAPKVRSSYKAEEVFEGLCKAYKGDL